MKDIIDREVTQYASTQAFFDELKASSSTSFGGWRNIAKYALAVAYTKHGYNVSLEKNEFGYSFKGLPAHIDIRSQDTEQLVNRFVMAGLLAIETDNPEQCFQFGEAWALYKVRHNTSRKQSNKAKGPREKKDTTEIIERLAKKDGSAKELWAIFIGEIDLLKEDVKDGKPMVLYLGENDQEQKMSLKTFENRISSARNPKQPS